MSRFDALDVASRSNLDTRITVRLYDRAFIVGSTDPDSQFAEFEVWAARSDYSASASFPRFIGGNFTTSVNAGFLVRYDPRFERVPNTIGIVLDGDVAVVERVTLIGRRRYMTLST